MGKTGKVIIKRTVLFFWASFLLLSVSCFASESCIFLGKEDGVKLEAEVGYNRIFLRVENVAAPSFTVNSLCDSFYLRSCHGKTFALRVVSPEYYSCVLMPGERWLIILKKPEVLDKEKIQFIFLYFGSEKKEIWLMPSHQK